MQLSRCLVVLLFSSQLGLSCSTKTTPVQQVLSMMGEMKAKGEKTMETEQKVFAEYAEWVDDRQKQMGFEIKTAQSTIDELVAFIAKAENQVKQFGQEISVLDGDIARLEGEKKDAENVRAEQHVEYETVQQDYSESVDALGRAIQTLSQQAYSRPQAEMLLQKMAKDTSGMRRVLAAFLQEKGQEDGAPAVAAYEFQAGGIVELLEGLEKKFKTELDEVERAESDAQHYFNLEFQHLSDNIAVSKSDREEKTSAKAKTAAASAKAQGELADTRADLKETQTLLAETTSTFEAKSSRYAANQEVRKAELEAISKAIEIISSPEVASSYGEHINLAQVKAPVTSMLQLRSSKKRTSSRDLAIQFLQRRATALSSRSLASIAAQMAANPFAKVVTLIEDLLERLKAEAAAESDHKAWCDEQLKNNKLKRDKKTSQVNKLTADIEELTAEIQTMASDIATLVQEQADLVKAMDEATTQRQKEHAENTDTIADAKAGNKAVKAALVILREFYASQSSFLQHKKQVPELAAYKGQQAGKGGVIGMLEVIEADFLRLDTQTTVSEKQAAREYDGFMDESRTAKKEKHDAEVKMRLDKDQTEFEKSQTIKDLKATQEELDRANDYHEELKPNCLEVHVSYEERAAKRKEELEALNQAWTILDAKGK